MNKFTLYRNVIFKFLTIIVPIFLATTNMVCSEEITYYSADLPIPQNLDAQLDSAKIDLTWDEIDNMSFNVYRSIDSSVFININTGEVLFNRYSDSDCTTDNGSDPVVNIQYKVRSTKSDQESDFSELINVQGSCTVTGN